ncbi:MAG TPA: hypothetical protein VHL58_19015, partial [Thermoanaerobaculia bacterium]|nr:hypothetical protein [Thermoanaerobaculia bacterium]
WDDFEPTDFEYDFERDKLAAHGVTFEEAVETFFSDFLIRRNKKDRDRYRAARPYRRWPCSQDHFSVEDI